MKIVKSISVKLLLAGLLIITSSSVFAQKTVSGEVEDMDGNTLPGVNVTIQGTTTGTITGANGQYSIKVPGNDAVLVFSFVGYVTEQKKVGDQTKIDVVMMPDIESLGEVVVIGYGVQKEEDATGSVQAIDARDFNQGAITSPQDLLTGKVAGVQITSSGGAPGEGSQIRIRGGASLSATNDPLIVVDGVPISGGGISGARNPLNTINPNDIETFTVLKDASATAIYGSRASNGVIIITTKKGKAGEEMKITYNGKLNAYVANKKVDVLDAEEFFNLVEEKFPEQVNMLGISDTDWQDEIYQNAFGTEHNIAASGAYKMLPYRLSVGYSNNDGILKTDNNERFTGSLNLNPSFLDDHLKVNVNVKGSNIQNTFANRDAIGAAIQYDPTKPVKSDQTYNPYYTSDIDGDEVADTILMPETDYGGYWTWVQDNGSDLPVEQGASNPVALLNMRDDQSTVNSFIGNAQVDYKLHFFPDLKLKLNLGYDYSKGTGEVIVPSSASWTYDPVNGGGTFNEYEQTKKNQLLDFYGNYVKEIAAIDSKVDIMGGYSWQRFYYKNDAINGNYISESTISPIAGQPGMYRKEFSGSPTRTFNIDSLYDEGELYLISFYGRLNYSLKNKYLLTFTVREDGTSRFSPDNRWGFFPSLALGWKIHEESFMQGIDVLSKLKLRAGWGVTGQQDVGGYYEWMPRYTYSLSGASYMFGDSLYQTIRPEGYDESLKWEETTTWNVAFDYGFLEDRITGSIDVYYRETRDLLNYIPVPGGSNLTNYINTNVGNMENKGIEFTINGKAISTKDMVWDIGLNMTYNENKITKLTLSDDPDYLGVETGGISGGVGSTIQMHSVGHSTNSFFVYEQVYDENGDPIPGVFVDQNGDGTIDDDDRVHKENPNPDLTFGISSSFNYKNWYFSFAGRANFGNYVYYNVDSENGVYERLYRSEGPYLSNVTSTVYDSDFDAPWYLSDYYIRNGSFFRMDNITLSYLFEDVAQQGFNVTVSGTVNNAFVITKYEGLDPELTNGIDNRIYPRPTSFALGVNVTF